MTTYDQNEQGMDVLYLKVPAVNLTLHRYYYYPMPKRETTYTELISMHF